MQEPANVGSDAGLEFFVVGRAHINVVVAASRIGDHETRNVHAIDVQFVIPRAADHRDRTRLDQFGFQGVVAGPAVNDQRAAHGSDRVAFFRIVVGGLHFDAVRPVAAQDDVRSKNLIPVGVDFVVPVAAVDLNEVGLGELDFQVVVPLVAVQDDVVLHGDVE